MFLKLLAAFAIFTVIDAINTAVGLSVGLIELNPIVAVLGLPTWILFRTTLLTTMIATFFMGNMLCTKYFHRGTRILEATLLMLNVYIGVVVFMGLFAIFRITL